MNNAPDQVSLIKAVTTPLGLFVLVLTIVELTLLANLTVLPNATRGIIAISAVVIIILIILLVAILAVRWPGALDQSDVSAELIRSIGVDVCTAYDAYISNLESAEERTEAWETLIELVAQEGAATESGSRKAMAKVIRDRSVILNR